MPNNELLRERYESWHQHWSDEEDRSGGALEHPWHRTVAPILRQWAAPWARVLEIGCGRGDFSIWIARECQPKSVVGVDFSPTAIRTAQTRREQLPNVLFEVADAQRLPFADGQFDVIVSCETLEHVPDPLAMALEMSRVLAPGGRFVLTTENYFNGMTIAWLKAWLTRTSFDSGSGPQPYENFFLFWRVRKLLERGGLTVDSMRSNHFQWLLLPRVSPAALCTESFESPKLNRLFRPVGRHFTFIGHR